MTPIVESAAFDITFIMMCASYIWYRKYSGHLKKNYCRFRLKSNQNAHNLSFVVEHGHE